MELADAAGPMPAQDLAPRVDRLGERSVGRRADGVAVETFAVRHELSGRPEFCAAVAGAWAPGDRPSRGLARLIGVRAPSGTEGALLLHQEWLEGERLDEVARRRRHEARPFSLGHVLFVLRETCAALRALHARGAGACHGALSPARLFVTGDDRLVVCEHVLGPGLAALPMPAEWFGEVLGLPVPRIAGIPLFTPLTDQLQLAHALVDLLGGDPALPAGPAWRDQLAALRIVDPHGVVSPIGDDLRQVLERMLLLSPEGPYRSMIALERAVEALAAAHPQCVPSPPPVSPAPPPDPPPAAAVHPPSLIVSSTSFAPAGEPFDPATQVDVRGPTVGAVQPPLRLVGHAFPEPPDAAALAQVGAGLGVKVASATSLDFAGDRNGASAASGFVGSTPPLLVDDGTWVGRPQVPLPDRSVRGTAGVRARSPWWAWGALAVGLAAVLAGAWWLVPGWRTPPPAPSGWLRLESKPAGATVTINGESRGQTPLTLSVPAGAYSVEFVLGGEHRALTVPVTAHGEAFQLVSLYPAGPPGSVSIASVPSGATVTLNGQVRGRTPLDLREVAPGEHTVRVENDVARTERTVEVLAGARVEVSVPLSGSVFVESPFEVTVSDGARLLGRASRGTVAVSTGLRRLTFANTTLNYEETREVEVTAGATTPVTLRPPTGVLNLDADTPAQVLLDGRPLGLTPLTNVAVSLGTHEVVFRDFRGGEVRYVIVVALGPAYRLRATLQSKPPPRAPGARRR